MCSGGDLVFATAYTRRDEKGKVMEPLGNRKNQLGYNEAHFSGSAK
jgi:hypothetical protein